jgi:hypothetical protein
MDTTAWIIIAVVAAVLVVVLVTALLGARSRRRHALQSRFGDEYDRTIESHDKRRAAERDLRDRERTRDELDIRPLTPAARDRFASQWETIQAGFVDRPQASVQQADDLVREVMRERGYPVDDFDAQADLVSVDYPHIVEDYRAAHGIAERSTEHAGTEDLRVAVVHYRSLFEALLEVGEDEPVSGRPVSGRIPESSR